MYVILKHKGVDYLFVECSSCHKLTQITGKKKPLKVRTCWNCGYWYVENGEGDFEK